MVWMCVPNYHLSLPPLALAWISPRFIDHLRSHFKYLKVCFIRYPNTSKSFKETWLCLVFLIYFSVFGYLMKQTFSTSCLIYYITDGNLVWVPRLVRILLHWGIITFLHHLSFYCRGQFLVCILRRKWGNLLWDIFLVLIVSNSIKVFLQYCQEYRTLTGSKTTSVWIKKNGKE